MQIHSVFTRSTIVLFSTLIRKSGDNDNDDGDADDDDDRHTQDQK